MNQLLSPLTFATDQLRAQSLANLQGYSSNGGVVSGDVVISGNLTVAGSQTVIDSTVLNVENNTITLNSNVVGTPVLNAGLLVTRGSQLPASLKWNESLQQWTAGVYGSESVLMTSSATLTGDVTGTLSANVLGTGVVTTAKLAAASVTYSKIQNASAGTFLANSTGSAGSLTEQPITSFGLSLVNSANAAAARSTIGTIGKYSYTLPGGSTTATVTHNLGTQDIAVSIVDLSNNLLVTAGVTIVDNNSITVTFSSTIVAFTYRCIVFG